MSASYVERKATIDRLAEEGLSLTEIGETLGVSRTTVSNWRRHRVQDGPLCPDCGNPMLRPARRCGLCAEELELGAVAA